MMLSPSSALINLIVYQAHSPWRRSTLLQAYIALFMFNCLQFSQKFIQHIQWPKKLPRQYKQCLAQRNINLSEQLKLKTYICPHFRVAQIQLITMNFFKQLTNFLSKPQKAQTQKSPKECPKNFSNSFEVIVSEILQEPPSEDFILLGLPVEEEKVIESQGVENMYIKGFLLIGKHCEGQVLSVETWKKIIINSDLSLASKKDIYFSIFHGIDYRVRKDVWQVLANSSEMKKETKLTFCQLCDPSKLPKSEIDLIDKDVVRTNIVTKNLGQLRQILIAYARLSQKGYTQGMNIIAGVLLKLLQIDNDDQIREHAVIEEQLPERVFWVLVGIMKWKGWSQVFEADLTGVQRMLQVLKKLMEKEVPKILQRVQELEWDLGIFAQYYVTICLYNCPPDLAPIILDLFLLDGEVVVHSLLIRMLVLNEQKILAFKDESHLMKYLKMQMLNDTYSKLLKNRANAKRLQDFQINFLKTTF